MQCSVYCAAFLIEALYNGDRSDLAYDLLTSTGTRSWLNMINDGAGATAEAWDASLKPNMTYSHPWAASPAYNVPQGMFGIRPTTPGYGRSEEHTSELQSLMRISYAVFCLKKKNKHQR